MTAPLRRRALRALPVVGLVVATTAVAGGCGVGCTETEVEVSPVQAATRSTPITLSGRLLGDGTPLAEVTIDFFITIEGQDGRHVPPGTATTDADGRASVPLAAGIAGALLPGDRETGYEVEFSTITNIDGTNYCDARAKGEFTA